MKRNYIFIAAVILTLSLFCTLTSSIAAEANETGVVLLHGNKNATKYISPLVKQLKKAGIQVISPEMTWSEKRKWDASFSDTMAEIDSAVASLKEKGATKIFVGGHSTGASAAVAYSTEHKDIAGLLLIAPAHTSEIENSQEQLAANVELAKQKIAGGEESKKIKFKSKICTDVIREKQITKKKYWYLNTTPKIYLSHFDPDFKDLLADNIQKTDSGTAVLWIAGKYDSWTKGNGEEVFGKAPSNPQNKYIVVGGGHLDTPRKGKKEIVSWVMETGSKI